MPEYKRFIAYFYEYIDGRKQKSAGFAKVELRGGIWRILFRLTAGNNLELPMRIYGFVREGGYLLGLPMGAMHTGQEAAQEWAYRADVPIKGTYLVENLAGIWIQSSDERIFLTVWDEDEIDPGKFVLELPEKAEEEAKATGKDLPESGRGLTDEAERQEMREPESGRGLTDEAERQEMREPEPGRGLTDEAERQEMRELEPGRRPTDEAERQEMREPEPGRRLIDEAERQEMRESEPEGLESGKPGPEREGAEIPKTAEIIETAAGTAGTTEKIEAAGTAGTTEIIEAAAAEIEAARTGAEKESSVPGVQDGIGAEKGSAEPGETKKCNTESGETMKCNTEPGGTREDGAERSAASAGARQGDIQELFRSRPRCQPFRDREIVGCVMLRPCDIVWLQQRGWQVGRSSFLQHGFYQYRHLLLGTTEDGGTIVLGVPGVYNPQEKYMAGMFGFENFKESGEGPSNNRFGYWCRKLERRI